MVGRRSLVDTVAEIEYERPFACGSENAINLGRHRRASLEQHHRIQVALNASSETLLNGLRGLPTSSSSTTQTRPL